MQLRRQPAARHLVPLPTRLVVLVGDCLQVVQHQIFLVRRAEPLIGRVNQQGLALDEYRSAIMIDNFAGIVLFQVGVEGLHARRARQRDVQLGILLAAEGLGRIVPGRKHFLGGAYAQLAGIQVPRQRVENLPGLAQVIGGAASQLHRPAIHRRCAGERIDGLHELRSREPLAQGGIQG